MKPRLLAFGLLPAGAFAQSASTAPTTIEAKLAALEAAVRVKFPTENPLQGRVVMVVGVSPRARSLAGSLKERGAALIIASHDRKAAQQAAEFLGCRYIGFEAIYSTLHDTLIYCDAEDDARGKAAECVRQGGSLGNGCQGDLG